MELPPNNSMFEVFFDWKTGEVDREKCQREVNNWAEENTFPEISLPVGFLTSIVEVSRSRCICDLPFLP